MNLYQYSGKIEHSDEINLPYFIKVTIRVLPAVLDNIEVLNQVIHHIEFKPFIEIKSFSLMKIPYRSRDAYTTTYQRRVDKMIYQRGRHHHNDELCYFFSTLKKTGYIIQECDRKAWEAEIMPL